MHRRDFPIARYSKTREVNNLNKTPKTKYRSIFLIIAHLVACRTLLLILGVLGAHI